MVITTEDFIRKAKEKHGNKYDYSKVDYKKATEKVIIICPEHGEFEQTPHIHNKGSGCSWCKYDYRKVEYKDSYSLITIICKEHGEFQQRAGVHYRGYGCQKCSGNYVINTEEFIEKAKKIHGDKYNYSKVVYVNSTTKVKIICKNHGEQHYYQIDHFHREDNALLKQQIRDEIKKRLCKKEGIKLIEIPYYIKNKEEFIKSKINCV